MNKNKLYIIGLLLSSLSFTACHDELLNPVPESTLTTANAFETAADIDLATLGVYQSYQARIPTDYELMETPSDNMYGSYFATAPGMAEIALLDVSSDNPKLNTFWKNSYNGIFRANSVLTNIEKPTDYAEGQKEKLMSEAKFMRALFYFDLVRIFGGVPAVTTIITETEAKELPRASEEEIYNLIIADLNDAKNNLPNPDATPAGRASSAAAAGLLAKVHVYRKNWAEAKTNLEQLLNNYNFSLVADYKNLFQIATENNSEVIFSMPFVSGTNGQNLTYALSPPGGIYQTINNGSRVARPTWDLHKAYEEGDSRFEATITEEQIPFAWKQGDPPIWYPYFNKWIIPVEISNSSGLDIPVLRLADMILLYAEALYYSGQTAEALTQLNKVRARAFKNSNHNYTAADIANEEMFLDKLLLERRLELAVENNRWFDLVRTGRFTEVLTSIEGEYNPSTGKAVMINVNAKPFMKYFPIPYEQIQLSSPGVLKQNEGYK